MRVLLGFSHIGLGVSDIERSARFYIDVLGFSELYALDFSGDEVAATMEQHGAFRSRMLLRDDVRLELLQWVDVQISGTGERKPMTELGFTHLSFRVDDIDELSDAIRAAGGAVHEQTRTVLGTNGNEPPPTKLLYITDPDGTRIELMENVPDLASMSASIADGLASHIDATKQPAPPS